LEIDRPNSLGIWLKFLSVGNSPREIVIDLISEEFRLAKINIQRTTANGRVLAELDELW
jgi:hypothetical protein